MEAAEVAWARFAVVWGVVEEFAVEADTMTFGGEATTTAGEEEVDLAANGAIFAAAGEAACAVAAVAFGVAAVAFGVTKPTFTATLGPGVECDTLALGAGDLALATGVNTCIAVFFVCAW